MHDFRKWKDQLQSLMASSDSVNDIFKQQTMNQLKLVQLEKVL
jgi:hypothetical protein